MMYSKLIYGNPILDSMLTSYILFLLGYIQFFINSMSYETTFFLSQITIILKY